MDRPLRHLRRAVALAVSLVVATTLARAGTAPIPSAVPGPATRPDKPPAKRLPPAVDEGIYTISAGGERLGSENFAFRVLGDSLCLASQSLTFEDQGGGRRDTVDKRVFMAVGSQDLLLHTYQSNQHYQGRLLIRAVQVNPSDSVFSVYREFEGRGVGDRVAQPPGRMYVMDSRLYSLIDFITLSVHDQGFDRRPISVFALGAVDTLVEATLARTGRDTLRVDGRPRGVGRMRLTQGSIAFELWVDDRGRLLRLEHPPTGLVVARRGVTLRSDASAAAPRAAKPAPATRHR